LDNEKLGQKLLSMQSELEGVQRQHDRDEGQLGQVGKTLLDRFNCSDVEDGQTKLEQMQTDNKAGWKKLGEKVTSLEEAHDWEE